MGNSNSSKYNLSHSRHEHWRKISDHENFGQIQSIPYSKWIKSQRNLGGFTDYADFTTCRESRLRHGVLVKPDNTGGRYLIPSFKSKFELVIVEKQRWFMSNYKLPRVPVPDFEDPHWFQRSSHNRNRRECSVIGYHDNLLVVQINTNRYYLSPRFYLIDLETNEIVGHFLIFYHCRRWYECYISPCKKQILMRPDNLTRIVSLPDNYILENVCLKSAYTNMEVNVVPPTLRAHVICYNSIAGDNLVLVAFHKTLEIRRTDTWEVVRSVQNLDLPTGIQQMKSSPLGDFLALRCVSPVHSKEYSVNVIAVLDFHTFSILMKVDVKGCYWPVSEVVNLQVFPHFSPSEATIAVMRNCTYSRKVMTYKLPICRFNLQYLCRRAILHLVSYRDVHKLPLPANIVNFLLAKPGYTHIGVSDRKHPC